MNNKVSIVTAPDDLLQDGIRILAYGLEKEQSTAVSNVIFNLKDFKPTIIYVANGDDDQQWALDKKQKCSIIIFNADSVDQIMIGYLAAQANSYYFGDLRTLGSINRNKIYSQEQLKNIMEEKLT
jgi:hypothetical protein